MGDSNKVDNYDDRLFLLVYDDYDGDWQLWGTFNNNDVGWEHIRRITTNGMAYQVVKGKVIERFNGEDADFP